MIGYKGFDKNFRCRGMQYKVGKTYRHDGELKICDSGLHFCTNPLAVFEHYPPTNSRYALIEATGNIVEDDDKCCTDELKIVRELSLTELIEAFPEEYISSHAKCFSIAHHTGECSASLNRGYHSVAASTGYASFSINKGFNSIAANTGPHSVAINKGSGSVAINVGYNSASEVEGIHSVAINIGNDSRAKGSLGCWLVLGEWRDDKLADVQVFKVDGEHIKPDTFYQLKDGKATEVQS